MAVNSLEGWVAARSGDEIQCMNLLQNYGVISDNCVHAKDVANDKEAMVWLAKNFERLTKRRV
jgi:hypothetical protein